MDMGDVVKVTVIATGFDAEARQMEEVQPQAAARTSRPSIPVQVPSRRSVAPRESIRARRSSVAPEQVSISEARVGGRAFGATALHDEAVLDIPAYLRRGSAHD